MNIHVTLEHKQEMIEVEAGTLVKDLAKHFEKDFSSPIVLAVVDGKLRELNQHLNRNCSVLFLDHSDKDGYRAYQRSLTFLFIKVVKEIFRGMGNKKVDVRVQYTINQGIYCELLDIGKIDINQELVDQIQKKMQYYVDKKTIIKKTVVTTSKAIHIFREQHMDDKVKILKYRSVSNTNLYELDGFYDYHFGYMVPSLEFLGDFKLHPYDGGIMIQAVSRKHPDHVGPLVVQKKLYQTQKEGSKWGKLMNVTTIGELNELISEGEMDDLILVAEALMEKKIGDIAEKIISSKGPKHFVFIAGPSSSGKTTFAHRLSVQLKTHGMRPRLISLDNYFVNREQTPKDENGDYDYETIKAIDVELFNHDMLALLDGELVDLPTYNFISGEREYKNRPIKMDEQSLLIVEGIHGLNETLSHAIEGKDKFKIYISAMTQLNLDYHNRIPTTDGRLIRRIVRDNQYRGVSALQTISRWPSVRRGEEKYIFPFQEEADVMFNSALIYEFAVLKQYALPLLYNIPENCPEHIEAKRLIKFLDYILGVSSEKIPNNSLIREFIGGSCFRT